MNLVRALVLLSSTSLLAIGCGDDNGGDDLAAVSDLSAVADMATPNDLAQAPQDLKPACDPDGGIPSTLECAGLYDSFAAKTVRADVLPFAPGYELWSDGAVKSRFIYLPPGEKIDVTNMANWVFPVGTKIFKEFKLTIGSADKRVETRMWWKRGDADWVGVVYRWSDAEDAAPRLETGAAAVGGTTYEIPAENRCVACHLGKTDKPAGFEAVLLAAPAATGLTWDQLKTKMLVTSSNGNDTIATSSLQIPGNSGDATLAAKERAALGFLHVNCGVLCHKAGGPGPFRLDIDVSSGAAPADVQSTTAFTGAIGINSNWKPAGAAVGDLYYRINPTEIGRSAIRLRMNIRDALPGSSGVDQMPPLLSHIVPAAGLLAIDAWITAMVAAPYPAPGPDM
jgi:hypothetical protein